MINNKQIKYLINDVISFGLDIKDIDCSIKLDLIEIKHGSNTYQEKEFSFYNPILSKEDIIILEFIYKQILEAENNYDKLVKAVNIESQKKVNYIKIINFFICENYLKNDFDLDKHGRVSYNAVKKKFRNYLEIPIVDILIDSFLKNLKVHKKKKNKVFLTCDYDILDLWSEIGKIGFIKRQIKNFKKLHFKRSYNEIQSISKLNKNIEFNYLLNDEMFLFQKTKSIEIENIAFWLIQKDHPLDSKNNFDSENIKTFIKNLSKKNVTFGLHPNYISSSNSSVFKNQIIKFKNLFKQVPLKIRFHYLKCEFPNTFDQLEKTVVKEDFTYAFPDAIAFRGGRSKPIKLWNKNKERPYDIISWPLTIMDGTLNDYMNLNYKQALKLSKKHILYSLALGNICDLLWHNRSLYKYGIENNYHPKLIKDIKSFILEIDNIISN